MSKHWKGLFIKDVFEITGRGTLLAVCIDPTRKWVDEIPIKEGDTIGTQFGSYKVKGIELFRNLFDSKISTDIGILVTKIDPKESLKTMKGSYTPFNDGVGIVGYGYVCPECKHETQFTDCDEGCEKCGFSEPYVDSDDWYDANFPK